MGNNIHTPRPIYAERMVMEFCVSNKEIFYVISRWNEDGTNLAMIEKGGLKNRDPQQILDKALHLVGDGIRN